MVILIREKKPFLDCHVCETSAKIETQTQQHVNKNLDEYIMFTNTLGKTMAATMAATMNPIVTVAVASAAVSSTATEFSPKITEKERSYYTGPYSALAKFKTPEDEYAWSSKIFKNCTKCKKTHPLINFNGNTASSCPFDKQGYRLRRPECSECTKSASKGKTEATKKAKELGISTKAPEGTLCELCGALHGIVFDHDHESPQFRGWLCDPCNRSMGVLGDNVVSLLRVVNYLNKHEKKAIIQDSDTLQLKLV